MEEVFKTSSAEIHNENINPAVEREGISNLKTVISSKKIFPVEDENLEKVSNEAVEEANDEVNSVVKHDSETLINGESTEACEFLAQKKFSPTLIESAFKVMKNLFSPDKTKSRSTGILKQINQPLNSGSPSSNLSMPGNTELYSSEPDTENHIKIQPPSGENVSKNQLQNDDLGIIHSPFSLDPLNNTDESFITTVSLIDESFHSAVTHFDEHGDILKNGINLMESILNNSQNLDLIDPYNDTLENNESLENTTLKLGNLTFEENKVNDILIQSKVKNVEILNNPQISTETPNLNGSEKVQYEDLQENSYISTSQIEKELKSDAGVLTKSISKRGSSQDIDHQENLNTVDLPAGNYEEIKSPGEVVEASHLFLNKSFEKQISESEIGPLADEPDFCVDNSISTTTVVLRTVDSVVIDNMLMSLKADDSETNTSSVTSFDSDEVTSSLENVAGKMPIKELDSTPLKGSSEGETCASENFFSLVDEKKACINGMNSSNNKPNSPKIKLKKRDKSINLISSEGSEIQNEKDSSVDILLMKNNEVSENSKLLYPHTNVTQIQAFEEHNQSETDKSQESLHLSKPDAVTVISQQSYTILTAHDNSLNRPVIEPLNISNGHLEKKTFQLNQSTTTPCAESENMEKHSVNNCSNASFGTEELVKSQIKQSTPLWEKHNESSQRCFRPNSLKLNSPGLKEFSHIYDSLHDKSETEKKSDNAKPDLLVKAKEIFHHEGQVEYSPVNPVSDNELLLSNSIENGGGENSYLYSTKILQSKDLNEINQGFVKQLGLNESKKSPDNLIRTSNRNPDKAPSSSEPKNMKQAVCKSPNSPTSNFNQTFEKKSKSPSVNSKNQTSDAPNCNKLNSTFDKQTVSSKKNFNRKPGTPEVEKINQTFTKKRGSPEINNINRAFDRSESPKPDKLNKTYEKPTGNNELNRTFDKKADGHGPQILNQTFDKKSGSPLPCERTQIIDKTSPDGNQNNLTFCKGADFNKICLEKKSQRINETYEGADIAERTEIKECNINLVSETKVENLLTQENKTFEKKTSAFDALNSFSSEDQTSLNTDFISSENLEKINKNFVLGNYKDINDSFASTKSSNISLGCGDLSTVLLNEDEFLGNQSTDELLTKLEKMNLNENSKHAAETQFDITNRMFPEVTSIPRKSAEEQNPKIQEKMMTFVKDEKMHCDSDIVQLIQEQFSLNDIEKICNVARELTSVKLGTDILETSAHPVTPFQEDILETEFSEAETKADNVNALSPKSFDFLSSIRGKPTGRDLSRESLYVKFDPLVQPSANSLIDFTKEGEQLTTIDASPINSHNTSVCEKLLTISPQKKVGDIVPPLTPLSDKTAAKEDKIERLKELQNEIYFLKNLFSERERLNRAKMEDYESQITKLTGESCMLEDKLKESSEREKSLVKKMKEQTQNISQLHVIMKEYSKVISKLTAELETIKKENQKQIESLSLEKDSYMTHLQNTEAAFTDVHSKYEKSKKTIVSHKANEAMYRNTIAEQTQKFEEFKAKAREAQEKAFSEFQKIQEQLNETKANHTQEAARLRALLRKTELKVEALQESLDQKLKENQQLTAICDELIEGKK